MRDNYDVYESREALQRPQGCASGLARTASKRLDDIGVWSDLVFQTVSKKFLPPIEQNNGPQGVDGSSTAGYRDYHEVAWVINRFARVARKHGLLEVCHTSLSRIYMLPNIEISRAFLKLREQARCHYQVPSELNRSQT
jgi:transformation/transcription domain-associated protein